MSGTVGPGSHAFRLDIIVKYGSGCEPYKVKLPRPNAHTSYGGGPVGAYLDESLHKAGKYLMKQRLPPPKAVGLSGRMPCTLVPVTSNPRGHCDLPQDVLPMPFANKNRLKFWP